MRDGHDPKRGGGIRRILVGVDGSEGACAALEWAIGLAEQTGAEVIAVHAFEVPAYLPQGIGFGPVYAGPIEDPDWWDRLRQDAERTFREEWCAPLAEAGLPHQASQEAGRAAAVIEAVAERTHADLVVVGRRGRGGLAELLLGSVSHALVHRSRRPVVVMDHR